MVVGVVLGSLAASLVAWQLGDSIGTHQVNSVLDSARLGETVHVDVLKLQAHGMVFVGPLLAAIVYVLCAAWTPRPQLRPAPEPLPVRTDAEISTVDHQPDDTGEARPSS